MKLVGTVGDDGFVVELRAGKLKERKGRSCFEGSANAESAYEEGRRAHLQRGDRLQGSYTVEQSWGIRRSIRRSATRCAMKPG